MISLKNKLILTIIVSLSFGGFAFASDLDMKSYIRTNYPDDIKTKRDLIKYILVGTEYTLYVGRNAPADSRYILSQSPDYQKDRVLASRIDALLMAVGQDNSIVIDKENKHVSVTRSPINGLH